MLVRYHVHSSVPPWRVKCRPDFGRAEAALTTPEVRIMMERGRLGTGWLAGARCLVDRGPSRSEI